VGRAVLQRRPSPGLILVACDVLRDARRAVRGEAWSTRQERLQRMMPDAGRAVLRSPSWAPSQQLLDDLLAVGWEGAVAKRVDSTYRCGEPLPRLDEAQGPVRAGWRGDRRSATATPAKRRAP
jgi:ATP-dependent DNA ligase